MATVAEVRQRVGEDLGLVPIGQDLESQDQLRIDATYTEQYARLKDRGLALWPESGPVPDKLAESFCLLMEVKLLVSYSVPESRYLRITTQAGPDGQLALAAIAGEAVEEYESHDEPTDF